MFLGLNPQLVFISRIALPICEFVWIVHSCNLKYTYVLLLYIHWLEWLTGWLTYHRIDLELLRLENKEEYEQAWKAKNNKVIEPTLPNSFDFDDFAALNGNTGSGATLSAEQRRDIRLVKKSPQMYCADRCVSTGHCDVLEDVLEMDAMEVIKFCKDCVLSVEEEPCDIPEKLLDGDYDFGSALMP